MRLATLALTALLLATCLPPTVHAGTSDGTYIGEIFAVAFSFCPAGSVEANGATLAAASNAALYALIGTNYGGTSTNFKIPTIKPQCSATSCIRFCIATAGIYPQQP